MKQYEMAWQVACGVVLAKWVLNPMIESWVEEWKKLPQRARTVTKYVAYAALLVVWLVNR